METITIQFSNAMLYDRIHTLSAEYNVSADLLIGLAVKRLIDDVEVVRNLRNGEIPSKATEASLIPVLRSRPLKVCGRNPRS